MQLILLEKVENLGDIGEVVDVRSGYGRNFLIPKGKAKLATKANLAEVEALRAELEAKAAEQRAAAEARAEQLKALELKITHKVGTEGKLFGSVGTADIAEAATAAGVPVERKEVLLTEGTTIRTVGPHEVAIRLHTDVEVTLTVMVLGEDMTEAEIEALEQLQEELPEEAPAEEPAPEEPAAEAAEEATEES